ncbi:MAG TPA: SGNH/GDSL hydrolase family protein, partial [Vicinamibacterales bacterium]|nr:SGNH/GDSL hydrolase family protein [Vicinamibacterales bacterium]
MAASAVLGAACAASPTDPGGTDNGGSAQVNYTALGASDALAIGASVSCLPFIDCPAGTGYVQIIGRRLADGGKPVNLLNLGIPGAVLSPRIQVISQSYGPRVDFNFLERQLPFVSRNSTVVTVFAGGNDTNVVARSVSGASNGNPRGYVDDQVRQFATEMAALVEGIRARAPSARIVIANLPNFAGTPFTDGYTLDQRRTLQQISVGFSREAINPLAAKSNVAVVDLLCEERFYASSNFSPDGFHPNDNGYAIMAEMMLSAIRSTSYPAPSASCGRMSIVPS